MAIPEVNAVVPVILDLLADGRDRSSDDIREAVAAHFHLTKRERDQQTGEAAYPDFAYRNAWGLVGLQRLRLIVKPDERRYVYRITERGEKEVLDGAVLQPDDSTFQERDAGIIPLYQPDLSVPRGERLIEEAMRQFFDIDEMTWKDEGRYFSTRFRGQNTSFPMELWVADDDLGYVIIRALLAQHAPAPQRPALYEFASIVNAIELIGTLSLNTSVSGEAMYRTDFDCGETVESVTPQLVGNHVYGCAARADKYYPGVMAVLFGGRSPAEVAAELNPL